MGSDVQCRIGRVRLKQSGQVFVALPNPADDLPTDDQGRTRIRRTRYDYTRPVWQHGLPVCGAEIGPEAKSYSLRRGVEPVCNFLGRIQIGDKRLCWRHASQLLMSITLARGYV